MERNPKYNASGCKDLTAYYALENIEKEQKAEAARFEKLRNTIINICDLAGFRVEGKLTLRNKKTGKVWR